MSDTSTRPRIEMLFGSPDKITDAQWETLAIAAKVIPYDHVIHVEDEREDGWVYAIFTKEGLYGQSAAYQLRIQPDGTMFQLEYDAAAQLECEWDWSDVTEKAGIWKLLLEAGARA